jgi:hypothetical protein
LLLRLKFKNEKKMNKAFQTTKIVPVIAIILCCLLYLSGHFQMIIAAIILIIASAIEYRKDLFKSLGFQRKRLNAQWLFRSDRASHFGQMMPL